MAVMRVQKNSNYTVMSNYHLDDKRLSLKAIGLLSKILRLPESWDYSVAGLTRICNEGKAAIGSAIKELEAAGYIERRQLHSASGTFSDIEYIVYECPQGEFSPFTENRQTVENQPPFTDFPSTDNRKTDTLLNKPNTILSNIPPISPKGESAKRGKRKPKSAPEWKPERFAAFWEVYPRGESKQAAIAAWDKLRPDDELLAVMGRALRRQMQSADWQRNIGIPYASTWLNKRRWEDEPRTPVSTTDERRYDVWT